MYNQSIAVLLPLLGAGTTRHATEMANAWSMQKYNVIFIEVYYRIINVKIYCDGSIQDQYKLLVENDLNSLKMILNGYHTVLLHVHHLLNLNTDFLHLHQMLNIPLVVTLHDYYMLCPYIKLTNEYDIYCEELNNEDCNKCLLKRPYYTNLGQSRLYDIQEWRNNWYIYLQQASLIVAPNNDVKKRFQKYFRDLKIKVIENPEIITVKNFEANSKTVIENGKKNIRIGLLGILSKPKGADVLKYCALDAKKRALPIQFVLFGDVIKGKSEKHPDNVCILGRYKENDIYSLIQQNDIDFFWFPAVWPETYSYTLTIPIRLNIPVVGTDLGAIGQRILDHKWGVTYPWNLNPSAINDLLVKFDVKKYKQLLFGYEVKNSHFPSIKSYYENNLNQENIELIAEIDIMKLKSVEKNALKHNKLKNINGYELKELFIKSDTLIAKIKLISKLNILWLANYLKLHSIKYVVERILK